MQFVQGDFVDLTNDLPPSTVVAFDRVVCCYSDYESLLRGALGHAEPAFAVSYL